MITRQNMAAIINQVVGNLNYYINVAAPSCTERNTKLTTDRVKNITTIRDMLNQMLESLSNNGEGQSYPIMINRIKNHILVALETNTKLSGKYGFIHRSYQENRLTGLGIFSSWLNKTWFQSRATTALESSLKAVERFQKQFFPEKESNQNSPTL